MRIGPFASWLSLALLSVALGCGDRVSDTEQPASDTETVAVDEEPENAEDPVEKAARISVKKAEGSATKEELEWLDEFLSGQ